MSSDSDLSGRVPTLLAMSVHSSYARYYVVTTTFILTHG